MTFWIFSKALHKIFEIVNRKRPRSIAHLDVIIPAKILLLVRSLDYRYNDDNNIVISENRTVLGSASVGRVLCSTFMTIANTRKIPSLKSQLSLGITTVNGPDHISWYCLDVPIS